MTPTPIIRLLAAPVLAVALCAPVLGESVPGIAIELNALEAVEGACRVTVLATNGLPSSIDRLTLETAFFGASGAIDRLVSLEVKGLTPGKTKVLQFALKDLDCTAVTRVLVNDVTACESEGLVPAQCLAALRPSARPAIDFGV